MIRRLIVRPKYGLDPRSHTFEIFQRDPTIGDVRLARERGDIILRLEIVPCNGGYERRWLCDSGRAAIVSWRPRTE